MTRIAIITGGSAGLGRALTLALTHQDWHVITDGRNPDRLAATAAAAPPGTVTAVQGDIADEDHRNDLMAAVEKHGQLDLLVNNAGILGPVSGDNPHRLLADLTIEDIGHVWRQNVGAPLALTTLAIPHLAASGGTLLSISSDAALEHYAGWGMYSASKAGLDHLTLTVAAENPTITAYAVDPGDMRTQMHQDWFPGEDISDRPLPETVVPHLLALLDGPAPSGRYRARDVAA
ncbi:MULTISPECIES: SDR family oxidoreductase [unclassified Nocardioides]|uniref:SDR family oxidoreductase n=1 Tax=unclassified Nocardioides TaxID=2615069 RepID=UPI0006F7F3C8|nr:MULTISPECIES: SDR family oxidoreductase [unclassified Nocardioides]KRA28212.1 short-chain dehydrogenase [Nocardioides sp. Root614]KRA86186.1 short-chain dehydrogenase [Nocardioides sp. Root682]